MTRGKVTAEWVEERSFKTGAAYIVKKTHGDLTIKEIETAMRDLGPYVIINHNDPDRMYAGWGDEEEREGDSIIVYIIQEGETCPVCGEMSPLTEYCPECGCELKQAKEAKG